MFNLLIEGLLVVAAFVGGVAYGATNVPSVTKAIAALKQAEQKAVATLAEITSHKAS